MIIVGKILSPHGITGAFKVYSLTQDPLSLFSFSPLYLTHNDQHQQIEKFASYGRTSHPHIFIASLSSLTHRNDIEPLKGYSITIQRDQLPSLNQEETYYYTDLIGSSVVDEQKNHLGKVVAVHNFGGGDILEISHNESSPKQTEMVHFQEVISFEGDTVIIKSHSSL